MTQNELPARTGNNYGDVHIYGSGHVQLGDRVRAGSPKIGLSEAEFQMQELRRGLYYDAMDQRRAQLAATTVASLDWIWKTPFKTWLGDETNVFWIHGKPGSGKSTLVEFLATSPETRQLLRKRADKQWHIFAFYFDFRAGNGIANNPLGMLRSVLFQLVEECHEIDEFIRRRHAHALAGSWTMNIAELMNTLCTSLESAKLPMCFFVDGLDEYNGKLTDLVKCLLVIAKRGQLKMCLASRPEPVIARLLSSAPAIQMQDHNAATIRDHIVSACAAMLSSDETATMEPIWQTVEHEANGVILWARFAVDELIEQTVSGATTDELQSILDSFPREMEAVYKRVIDKIPHHGNQRLSAAIAFHVLEHARESFSKGGDFPTYDFFICWTMMLEALDTSVNFDEKFDMVRFRARIHSLLGGLLEFSDGHANVRYVHKTLKTYLETSQVLEAETAEIWKSEFGGTGRHHLGQELFIRIIRQASEQLQFDDGTVPGLNHSALEELKEAKGRSLTATEEILASRQASIQDKWRAQCTTGHLSQRLGFLATAVGRIFESAFEGSEKARWDIIQLPPVRFHYLFCNFDGLSGHTKCRHFFRSSFPWNTTCEAHLHDTWHLRYLLYHEHYSTLRYGLKQVHSQLKKDSAEKLYRAMIACIRDQGRNFKASELDPEHTLTHILAEHEDANLVVQLYLNKRSICP